VHDAATALRHKTFYRRLDDILRRIDEEQGLESMLTTILAQIGDQVFSDDVGITSGRLYKRDHGDYVVVRSYGARGKEILGQRVPSSYSLLRDLKSSEVLYVPADDPRLDRAIESRLGVGASAAFFLGSDETYVAAFGIKEGAHLDEVLLILNALRYAFQHRLKELSLEGQLREARSIQVSLLPAEPPIFKGYDLAGHSIPADEVGGDIFDFPLVDEHLLGLAVGDASGHGLPAALQARDVVTGLRMGVERDLKITAVLRRLNRVIHDSGLTSRFVSLFYGELESSGTFVYCNAGHDPVLLVRPDGGYEELRSTGIVMGPLKDAEYRRELIHVRPGDLLILYTDGVVERLDASGEHEFGSARLVETVGRHVEQTTEFTDVPLQVLEEVKAFGGDQPWNDDATIVLVRRKASTA
jgi:sigma-B regulation protein RsbU (phosphoserine phosphatase)